MYLLTFLQQDHVSAICQHKKSSLFKEFTVHTRIFLSPPLIKSCKSREGADVLDKVSGFLFNFRVPEVPGEIIYY